MKYLKILTLALTLFLCTQLGAHITTSQPTLTPDQFNTQVYDKLIRTKQYIGYSYFGDKEGQVTVVFFMTIGKGNKATITNGEFYFENGKPPATFSGCIDKRTNTGQLCFSETTNITDEEGKFEIENARENHAYDTRTGEHLGSVYIFTGPTGTIVAGPHVP